MGPISPTVAPGLSDYSPSKFFQPGLIGSVVPGSLTFLSSDDDASQHFVGVAYSFQAIEEYVGSSPIIPTLAWDEVEWQQYRDIHFGQTTTEQDIYALPIIPTLAWDEDLSRNVDTRQQQDDEPWHTFFTIPGLAYEEDLSRSIDVRQQQDDEPWHTFFFIPTPPPNFGWDDWDWNKSFDVHVSQQDDEPWHTFFTIPGLAYEEDWSRGIDTRQQQDDEPWHTFFTIPGLAYEEDLSRGVDIRQQQDDEPWHTYFTIPTPPDFGWDEWDWNKNFDFRVSQQDDEPWQTFFTIPGLAYEEDLSRNIDIRQEQDDEPWHTFFTIPTPPDFGWDEWDWNKNFDSRVSQQDDDPWQTFFTIPGLAYEEDQSRYIETRQQQDDDPWHTFFTIPTPPPNLGWDDWDWCKAFQIAFVPQIMEEDVGLSPILLIAPFVFEDFSFFSGDDYAE